MVEAEEIVDVARSDLAGANRDNHRFRANLAVAAHEHVIELADGFQAIVGLEIGAIGLHARLLEGGAFDVLSHSDKHDIGRNAHKRLIGGLRRRASALHRTNELRLRIQRRHMAIFDFDVVGRLQGHHFDAFLHGGIDFGAKSRHVFQATAVRNRHARRAGANARAGAVHSDVAATDNHHVFAREIGIFAIADLREQIDRAHHALRVGAIETQRFAALGANRHIHRIVFGRKFLHAIGIDAHLGMHGNISRVDNGAHVFIEALSREAVSGNAIAHHAAELLAHLEHMHLMTHKRTEVSAGQSTRATAHDGDLLARRSSRRGRCDLVGGELVDRELLDAANVDGGINKRAAATVLARMLAHIGACRGKRVVFANHANGARIIARACKRHIGGHIHMRRAQRFARHCLGNAFAALLLANVAFELRLERIEAIEQHFGRMPADSAVGRVAHNDCLRTNLIKRARFRVERKHLFEQLLNARNALAARHALAARLATPGTQQIELERHRAHARRRRFNASLILFDKRAELAVVFRARRYRQSRHTSPFSIYGFAHGHSALPLTTATPRTAIRTASHTFKH